MSQIAHPHHLSLFEMTGPDASDFLHRLTTIDVKNMNAEEVASGFFLNPQGKIRSYFWLAKLSEKDSFLIELEDQNDGAWKKEFLSVIDQFTFSEKYQLSELKDLSVAWVLEDSNLKNAMGDKKLLRAEDCYWINHGSHQFGRPWFSIWGKKESVEVALKKDFASSSAISDHGLDRYRIEALRPKLGQELKMDSNPLELGLKEAIADQKGCYPGQEVIEKIIALGSPSKRLVLVQGSGSTELALHAKISISGSEAEIGELTSFHSGGNGDWIGLALIKKVHAKENQSIVIQAPHETVTGEMKRISTYV